MEMFINKIFAFLINQRFNYKKNTKNMFFIKSKYRNFKYNILNRFRKTVVF